MSMCAYSKLGSDLMFGEGRERESTHLCLRTSMSMCVYSKLGSDLMFGEISLVQTLIHAGVLSQKLALCFTTHNYIVYRK